MSHDGVYPVSNWKESSEKIAKLSQSSDCHVDPKIFKTLGQFCKFAAGFISRKPSLVKLTSCFKGIQIHFGSPLCFMEIRNDDDLDTITFFDFKSTDGRSYKITVKENWSDEVDSNE